MNADCVEPGSRVEILTHATLSGAVADVAAATFPLACPPHSALADIAAHIARYLSPAAFAEAIADADRDVLAARDGDGEVIGYALLAYSAPADPDVVAALEAMPGGYAAVHDGTLSEISKMYVLPDHHGSRTGWRPAHALMQASLAAARERGAALAWLGVNSENERARKYYRKMGFTRVGTRTFDMNGTTEHDYVMARSLS
ncbi:GNAT family N-acetyltransferase [Gordonia zhaorongruii]|uniref:GNAT family N-acetyltransferase n=1 Tax=Gordonia zhaorongruii TaxID=2597659 RepID=UPI00104CEF59|nr:GNAT family N-acetyltransferase [Gordonia zhaorongruii]